MNNIDTSKDVPDSGISLASVTAGIIAAAGFLLVSSFVSNDTGWTTTTDNVWATRTLNKNEMATTNAEVSGTSETEPVTPVQTTPKNKENGHFYDALYSADFMSAFIEPT